MVLRIFLGLILLICAQQAYVEQTMAIDPDFYKEQAKTEKLRRERERGALKHTRAREVRERKKEQSARGFLKKRKSMVRAQKKREKLYLKEREREEIRNERKKRDAEQFAKKRRLKKDAVSAKDENIEFGIEPLKPKSKLQK